MIVFPRPRSSWLMRRIFMGWHLDDTKRSIPVNLDDGHSHCRDLALAVEGNKFKFQRPYGSIMIVVLIFISFLCSPPSERDLNFLRTRYDVLCSRQQSGLNRSSRNQIEWNWAFDVLETVRVRQLFLTDSFCKLDYWKNVNLLRTCEDCQKGA